MTKASLILILICSLLPQQADVYGQSPQPAQPQQIDQFIARIRDAISLKDEQVGELRRIVSEHMPMIVELRKRRTAQPYAPGLQAEIDKANRAIKDEFLAVLSDDQKSKLSGVEFRVIPPPPQFIVIDIPRRRMSDETPSERLLPAVSFNSDARHSRLTEDHLVLHVLNRVAFGPRSGDLDRVKEIGINKYLEAQLHPEKIDDSELEQRLSVLPTLRMTAFERYQYYPQVQAAEQRAGQQNALPVFGRPAQILVELQQQKMMRAIYSTRQLQEVMADLWFNHFNVFSQKDAALWHITDYERDAIRPNAMGKFRDLVLAVAKSPAMLLYLDNWLSSAFESRLPRPPGPRPPGPTQPPVAGSNDVAGRGATASESLRGAMPNSGQAQPPSRENPAAMQNQQRPAPQQARRPGINENFARELLELHTVGVDGGYTQKDVEEVARCFTGWTVDRPNQGGGFMFRSWSHDRGAKNVLGVNIPAGGGIEDGYRAIEILSRHPSTARFIARKLCQRFISDSPRPETVERAAQVFLKTDGDIKKVLRAIFDSAEFNSMATFRSKVKSPLELVASAIRGLDGDTNASPALHDWLRRMGEPLYQCQAPTGYGEDSRRWSNTGVLLTRLNFGIALANNQIGGTRYEPKRLIGPANSVNKAASIDRFMAQLLHTRLSGGRKQLDEVRRLIGNAPSTAPVGDYVLRNVATAREAATNDNQAGREQQQAAVRMIELLLGTADFQRR